MRVSKCIKAGQRDESGGDGEYREGRQQQHDQWHYQSPN